MTKSIAKASAAELKQALVEAERREYNSIKARTRVCANSACKKLFLLQRKTQKYCSRKCQMAVYNAELLTAKAFLRSQHE